ncbi:MAG: hypothetical protein AABY01_01395 [Nanoarchaeota archaeon]
MNETTLLRIALTCIVIGIPAIYLITDIYPATIAPTATLTGTVSAVSHTNGTTLTLSKTVVVPSDINIKTGSTIRAKGTWNKDTFVASEITVT